MSAYRPDFLFQTAIAFSGGHPGISRYAKNLQDGSQILEFGNGPKQECDCWKISPPLIVDFVQFNLGTWMHMRGVYPLHMQGQRSHGAALSRCISGNEGQAE